MKKIIFVMIMLSGFAVFFVKPAIAPMAVMDMAEHVDVPRINLEPVAPIYDIGLSEEWAKIVWGECQAKEVEYELALAVMMTENRSFNPSLISSTNDYGLFQINRINHKRMAEMGYADMLNAEDNIKAGIHILSECLGYSDSYHEALMSYNMGRGGCNKAMAKGIYSTKYSEKVMSHYNDLKGDVYGKVQ